MLFVASTGSATVVRKSIDGGSTRPSTGSGTGMMAAPILIGDDSFICVVVVIYNLKERSLYLHETFLTEKIPEIAASSLVRGSRAASPQSQGSIAKILHRFLNTK